jgi:hypothetical protein
MSKEIKDIDARRELAEFFLRWTKKHHISCLEQAKILLAEAQ